MEIADKVFNKIKNDKIKVLDYNVFVYMISQTSNFSEAMIIENKLEFLKVNIT
ncbi:MAG TPA: hypothetical protein GX519_02985 [Thermoanaerobacterales bacterium]|nr:hypothetical protein [Thermoanaerobacterales bacterium]